MHRMLSDALLEMGPDDLDLIILFFYITSARLSMLDLSPSSPVPQVLEFLMRKITTRSFQSCTQHYPDKPARQDLTNLQIRSPSRRESGEVNACSREK